jgi:hypothetical protein
LKEKNRPFPINKIRNSVDNASELMDSPDPMEGALEISRLALFKKRAQVGVKLD